MISHFVGDFLFQPRKMALQKSSEIKWLLAHLGIIGFFTFIPFLFFNIDNFLLIWGLNLVSHGVTDWFIWRSYKNFRKKEANKLVIPSSYAYWNDPLFYTTIGLDQLIHYITLVGLYLWLS